MTNPKYIGGLELILFLLFLVFYTSDSIALKIFLNVLLVAYLTFNHLEGVSFFNFIENQGNFIKVEPKEYFTFSISLFFKVVTIFFIFFVALRLIANLGEYDFLTEMMLMNFPIIINAVTEKTNKAKGFYYLFDSGIFALKKQGAIIGWDEVERFENHSEKDHYVFLLKNDEKILVEKRSPEARGLKYEEEFTNSLLNLVKSKLRPNQVFEIIEAEPK